MKLIVGLGNPEEQFAGTRHNLGFLVLDEFRRKLNLGEWSLDSKFNSEIIKASSQLMLAKPQTYMNNSGLAISKIVMYFKIDPKDVIVVHDDLDLLLGKIKVRLGGGIAGHHGLESVMNSLGTDQFIRVRLGIGNSEGFSGEHKRINFSAEKFVLEKFAPGEKSKVKSTAKHAVEALEILLEEGLQEAQNQFN